MTAEHSNCASAETSGGVPFNRRIQSAAEAVGQGRAQNAEHAEHAGSVRARHVGAHQHAHPGDAEHDAAELGGGERLARQDARDNEGEQRGGRVQHRGEAAGDPRLAVEDQAERHEVVEHGQHDVGAPGRKAARQGQAEQAGDGREQHRGQRHARQHQRERRDVAHGDRREEERSAPEDGEENEQEPIGCAHLAASPAWTDQTRRLDTPASDSASPRIPVQEAGSDPSPRRSA